MATSLARQLQGIKANASNVNFQKRKRVASLLFEASDAADQDYDQVFAIASNGFEELLSINSDLGRFSETLFSEEARRIDRYTQTADQNESLDKAIKSFLSLAASHFLLRPLTKCLEWLVRRFDIHQHLAEFLLLTFLPFRSSSNFVRLLNIIELPDSWKFLSVVKKAAEPPTTSLFVKAFVNDSSILASYLDFVHDEIAIQRGHHQMITTYADISVRAISLMRDHGKSEEAIVNVYLSSIGDGLRMTSSTEYQIANYMILTVLSASRSLTSEVNNATMQALAAGISPNSRRSGLICLAQLCQSQTQVVALPKDVFAAIEKVDPEFEHLALLAGKFRAENLLTACALTALEEMTADCLAKVQKLVRTRKLLLLPVLAAITQCVLSSTQDAEFRLACATFLETLQQDTTFDKVLEVFYKSLGPKIDDLALALQLSLTVSPLPEATAKVSSVPASDDRVETIDLEDVISQLGLPDEPFLAVKDIRQFVAAAQHALSVNRLEEILDNSTLNLDADQKLSLLSRISISTSDVETQSAALQGVLGLCSQHTELDFQGLLPIVITLLSSKSQRIRADTLRLVNLLFDQAKGDKRHTKWGINDLYGKVRSANLKWLSNQEALLLISAIVDHGSECQLDHKTIYMVISKLVTLDKLKGKELSNRNAILAFLMSHAICTPIMKVLLKILLCLDRLDHESNQRSKAILPLLCDWMGHPTEFNKQCELECLDPAVIKGLLMRQLVAKESSVTAILLDLVRKNDAEFGPLALQKLTDSFGTMKFEQQSQFLHTEFKAMSDPDCPLAQQAAACIRTTSVPTKIFAQLLNDIILVPMSTVSSPVKKQKRALAQVNSLEDSLRRFTRLLEVIEHDAQPHPSLLPLLFSKLGDLVLVEGDTNVSVSYVEQMLLSLMYKLVEQGQFDASVCRIDILTNCIRSSSSSQVHNRALLLVARLADLAPEQVLHGMMPIFTFMGTNVLHQDDGFSAHVIDSTIRCIVPTLLKSLGENTEDRINGSAGLLRSFVDAFPHVPKHRRVKIFSTLVEVLGESIFLGPFLALLMQKSQSSTKNSEDQDTYIEFGVSLLSHFGEETQFLACLSVLEIANSMASKTCTDSSLLDVSGAGALDYSSVIVASLDLILAYFDSRKVRTALEVYALAGDGWIYQGEFTSIVASLLKLCAQFDEQSKYLDKGLEALDSVTMLVPIKLFCNIASSLLSSEYGDLYCDRILNIISRRASSTSMEDVAAHQDFFALLDIIAGVVVSERSSVVRCAAFKSISAIGRRFGKTNPTAIANITHIVIGDRGLNSSELLVRVSATECLATVVNILGPRILPHLQSLMAVILNGLKDFSEDPSADLVPLSCLGSLETLVKVIPSFMTPYTQAMITGCSKSSGAATEEMLVEKRSLLASIARHMPTKNILEAISLAWLEGVSAGRSSLLSLVAVMEETVECSSRKTISAASVEITSLFLQALDVRQTCKGLDSKTMERIENRVIAVFLRVVLKLNESTFRPLFVRLRDWALNDVSEPRALLNRRTVFFNFFSQFTGTFKSIVLRYFDYVLEDIVELLDSAPDLEKVPRKLWLTIITSLETGFRSDNEDFWRSPDKFGRLAPILIRQLEYAETYSVQGSLIPAIVELTSAASSEENFKLVNTQILQLFRSEKVLVRLVAVTAENKLTSKLGEEWLPMLPQTIPFIAEAMEDDDERVEKQTHSLALTIESFLGESIQKFLR